MKISFKSLRKALKFRNSHKNIFELEYNRKKIIFVMSQKWVLKIPKVQKFQIFWNNITENN